MHFGIDFKQSTVRKANLCLFPPSFLCFDNKDSVSHPITRCPSPALSLICPTATAALVGNHCVTQWDCWDTLIALLSTLDIMLQGEVLHKCSYNRHEQKHCVTDL